MNHSLQRRLLIVASLVLAAFLGTTGFALDQAFRTSLIQAQQDRLQGFLYTVLAGADVREGQLQVPGDLPEGRFHQIGSGLYAVVLDDQGRTTWRSRSLIGQRLDLDRTLPPGERDFYRAELDGERLVGLAYGLSWEDPETGGGDFTLHVAESITFRLEERAAYRRSLWTWLGGAGAGLLVAQLLVLRWGLRPLRRVTRDLQLIERGRKDTLEGNYPREVQGLTERLNQLICSERERTTHYRNSLADLAHSLKTPLAVLRTTLESDSSQPPSPQTMEQIERIHETVDYQLGRAALAGPPHFGESTRVQPLARRVMDTLPKTRPAGPPATTFDCPGEARFPGPEGDLMEILGNLVDNACKWCDDRISLRVDWQAHGRGWLLTLQMEDDGPGVPESARERILQRGQRADETRPGHGIGLAMVSELVANYRGKIQIDRSDRLGGARFTLTLPVNT
ncbi:ATP-binding protein [Methylonatrum kenyense]|uniref:ATP-binding protein n=1 Tax=Methylonatrum kenyense TaxID=455253 RepID=UPI0020C06A92|nr:ATP-binding protein [Methylonatrum kenyense]MCK8517136.1 ATP-binding protein [Methylonatrum kenyense]